MYGWKTNVSHDTGNVLDCNDLFLIPSIAEDAWMLDKSLLIPFNPLSSLQQIRALVASPQLLGNRGSTVGAESLAHGGASLIPLIFASMTEMENHRRWPRK